MHASTSNQRDHGKCQEKQDKRLQEPKRRISIKDYSLGFNQESYSLLNDLKGRKVDMTFSQALDLVAKLRREWRKGVSISKKSEKTTSIVGKVGAQEIPQICYNHERDLLPVLEVWCQGQVVALAYVDGGAHVGVITKDTARRLQLKINRKHAYTMNMANNAIV